MSNPGTLFTGFLPLINAILIIGIIFIINTDKPLLYIIWELVFIAGPLVFISNILYQYSACNNMDFINAAKGMYPTIITVTVAMLISSISFARIPIMSVFVPLFTGDTVDIVTGTDSKSQCCKPTMTLEKAESMNHPTMINISRGFYLAFAMAFGTIFGKGIAVVCNSSTMNTQSQITTGTTQTSQTISQTSQLSI